MLDIVTITLKISLLEPCSLVLFNISINNGRSPARGIIDILGNFLLFHKIIHIPADGYLGQTDSRCDLFAGQGLEPVFFHEAQDEPEGGLLKSFVQYFRSGRRGYRGDIQQGIQLFLGEIVLLEQLLVFNKLC